jgi:S1-C subfamily serine protease
LRRVGGVTGTAAIVASALLLPVAVAGASTRVEPGIVDVIASLGYQGLDTIGTGMVVDRSGEILTNNHVIRGATSIRISDLDNGRTYSAVVVGYDVSADVAVLRLEDASGLQAVTIGSSSNAKAGDAVTTIGNAGGAGGTPRRTTGEVVALDQSITALDDDGNLERLTGLIEMSAPLKPGDSGGPLIDAAGEVIGMDTAGSGQQSNTDGFAIPINRALSIANRIEHRQSSSAIHVGKTAFIGVNIESPGHTPGSRDVGALVTGVLSGTPASRAGIVSGDIIYSIQGRTIASPSALTNKLSSMSPGATARLAWIDQAGKSHRASVRLEDGPPQ